MTIKNGLKIVAIILAVFYLGFVSVSRAKTVPYERDEISWYFHTEFFDEAFVNRNIFSPLWDGYESFDHPQVSKYIYGAYLYFHNHDYARERDTLENKYGRWNMYYTIKSDPEISTTEFAPILFELRKVNIVFSLFILIEIVILFFMLSGSEFFSLFLVFVLFLNTMFIGSIAVVTSDNHFLFFGLLAILFYFRSMKSKQWRWIAGAAVATALSVGSKLTGIFLFPSVIATELIRLMYIDYSLIKATKRLGLYALVSIFVWIAINPALYRYPIQNTWRYFSFRTFQSENIAYHIPEAALHSVSDRASAIACTLILRSCASYSGAGSLSSYDLFNIGFLVMGLFYALKAIQKKKGEIILLILLGYFIFMGYIANLFNYSPRYYVLPQIIIFTFQIFGAWSFTMYLKRKFFFRGQRT